MSKLTRIIAIILFLAVGVLSFLPTLRISFAERPAEIPQEAADQLLDGLVKDAGGTNPISMHGLDSFAKKPGEEASTGLILGIVGLVLGAAGRKNATQRGVATAGMIIGIVGVSLNAIFMLACASAYATASSAVDSLLG